MEWVLNPTHWTFNGDVTNGSNKGNDDDDNKSIHSGRQVGCRQILNLAIATIHENIPAKLFTYIE